MSLLSALQRFRDPVESRTISNNAYWAAWRAGEDAGLTQETPAGVIVNRNTAMGISAVWACVNLISDSVATLPVDTVMDDGFGIEKPYRPRPSVFETPNPEQTKVDFIFNQIASMLLHGFTPVYTLRDRKGDVVESYALDPTMVQIRREYYQGRLQIVYYVAVGKGQQSPVGTPDVYRVPQGSEMFHVIGPQIHAGYPVGLPPLEVARMMYGGAIAAQEMGARFYGHGMNAAGVIEVPAEQNITTDQAKQLKEDFARANGGLRKMHLPPVLTGGATFKQVTISPEQAQFLQAREFGVDEIARWFRVPPHMIGHLVRSTSWGTGLEFQGMTFVNYTLRPWIERLEAAWTRWMLIFQPGVKVRFNTEGLLRGDLAARAAWYASARQNSWMNVDEIRAREGLPPLPDGLGEEYIQPVNYAPLGTDPAAPQVLPDVVAQ